MGLKGLSMKHWYLPVLSVLLVPASSAFAGSVSYLPDSSVVDLRDNRQSGVGYDTPDDGLLVFEEFSGITLGDVTDIVGSDYFEVIDVDATTLVSVHYLHYDPDHKTGGTLDIAVDLGSTILGYFGADAALNGFETSWLFSGSLPASASYLPGSDVNEILYPTYSRDRGAGAQGGGINDITEINDQVASLNWYVPGKARIDTMRILTIDEVAPSPPVMPTPTAAATGAILFGLVGMRRPRQA